MDCFAPLRGTRNDDGWVGVLRWVAGVRLGRWIASQGLAMTLWGLGFGGEVAGADSEKWIVSQGLAMTLSGLGLGGGL
jgi:hypothetical protein